MFMPKESFNTLECSEFPKFECHIRWSRKKQFALLIELNWVNSASMSFERFFQLSGIQIPKFYRTIFGSWSKKRVLRVEANCCHIGPVSRQSNFRRRFRCEKIFGRSLPQCISEFVLILRILLELLDLLLQLHHFLLQTQDWYPLLL